jgi:methylenetetrahydrofolate reductase (NADPH)
LNAKIEAGAEYIVTQMFFDNSKFFEFVNKCRELNINVPIIPGLKIITTKRQATILPKIFKIDIPQPLLEQIEKCKTDAAVKEVGIEWCINQAKELIQFKSPCLHFYTMGASETTRRVAAAVF